LSKDSSDQSKRGVNLDSLFSKATTGTFTVQLLAILVLIGAFVGYVLVLTGIWDLIKYNQDIVVFLILIGCAIAFAVFMLFYGFFVRFHGRVERFVLCKGIGEVTAGSRDGQLILSLFAFSSVFFTLAGIYAIYLLWKYLLPWLYSITNSIYPNIIVLCLAVLVVTVLIQLASRMVGSYARNVIERIT
jgi:hypothetical protein